MNDRFWVQTMANLAARLGAAGAPVITQAVCIDRRRQWRYVRNLRHSAAIASMTHTAAAPVRWARRVVARG